MKANIKATPKIAAQNKIYEKTLTVGMIVKNEEKVLRRCLESIAKLRNKINIEIIITDTGSSDNTLAIANEFADVVTHFEWCSDFGKARNVAMDMAKGEWFMYVDADEWFSDELIENLESFFCSDEHRKYYTGMISLRNFKDVKQEEYADFYEPRMIKSCCGLRFDKPIHETLKLISPEKFIKGALNHSGYVFSTEGEMRAKRERNNVLIEEYLKDNPNDGGMIISYYQSAPLHKKEELVKKLIALSNANTYVADYNNQYSCAIEYYVGEGRFAEAVSVGENYLSTNKDAGYVDTYYFIFMAHYSLGNLQQAVEFAKLYLADLKSFNKNPAKPKYVFVRKAIREIKLSVIYGASMCCAKLNDEAEFFSFIKQLEPTGNEYLEFSQKMWTIYAMYRMDSILAYAVELIINADCSARIRHSAINHICSRMLNDMPNSKTADALKKYMPNSSFTVMYDAASAETGQVFIDENAVAADKNVLLFYMLYLLKSSSVKKIEELLLNMKREEIIELVSALCSYNHICKIYPQICALPETQLCMLIFKHELLRGAFTLSLVSNELNNYDAALKILETMQAITNKSFNLSEMSLNLLPEANRFAVILERANNTSSEGYIAALREAIESSPSMKELAEVLLEEFSQRLSPSAPQPNEEFLKLAEQIKQSIPPLIAAGQTAEALKVLQQLKSLVPNDIEIDKLIYSCGML